MLLLLSTALRGDYEARSIKSQAIQILDLCDSLYGRHRALTNDNEVASHSLHKVTVRTPTCMCGALPHPASGAARGASASSARRVARRPRHPTRRCSMYAPSFRLVSARSHQPPLRAKFQLHTPDGTSRQTAARTRSASKHRHGEWRAVVTHRAASSKITTCDSRLLVLSSSLLPSVQHSRAHGAQSEGALGCVEHSDARWHCERIGQN